MESLLIGADFLHEYGLVVNFKTNCLMYEMEGNRKECKFTNKAEAGREPQENIGHGLPGTADHDVTQTINNEPVWTTRKYVAFINRNRELHDEVMEEEINPLDISVKKDRKRNTPCMSKALRGNMDDVIQFNACDKGDDFKGKKRKITFIEEVGESSNCEWIYAKQDKVI
jgi:hypothetical protein